MARFLEVREPLVWSGPPGRFPTFAVLVGDTRAGYLFLKAGHVLFSGPQNWGPLNRAPEKISILPIHLKHVWLFQHHKNVGTIDTFGPSETCSIGVFHASGSLSKGDQKEH